jgi:small subunit ribosomal protein S6
MLMTEYETTLVVRPDIGGDAIEATLDRVRDAVKNRGGKLLAINHWGKKKLAYPIMKHTRGIYVHTVYLGRDDLVTEVERNLRIADSVLRFLTVRVEVSVDPESRQAADYEAPEYDADAVEEQAEEAAAEAAPGDGAKAAPADGAKAAPADDAKAAPADGAKAAPAAAEAAEAAPAEAASAEAAPAEAAPAEAAPAEAAPAGEAIEAKPAEAAPAEPVEEKPAAETTEPKAEE